MTTITETIGGLTITRFPDAPPPTPQDLAMQTIVALEREQLMPRATREFILTLMESQAQEMGVTTEVLMTKNALYRRVKQFDQQIAELRAML
jgi:hypothetical protein